MGDFFKPYPSRAKANRQVRRLKLNPLNNDVRQNLKMNIYFADPYNFCPMGDFFKPYPSRAKAGFKKSLSVQLESATLLIFSVKKWLTCMSFYSDDCSYLCKGLNIYSSFIKFKNKRKK
jgi:hypothetical protein